MRFSKSWGFFKGWRWNWSGSWSFGGPQQPDPAEGESAGARGFSAQAEPGSGEAREPRSPKEANR
jgi:hypothetical protein